MPRLVAVLAFAVACSHAPLQCGSEPDPSKALEETPGEAIYQLALELREAGQQEAWAAALRFIIERYPSSRFAEMARLDLEEAAKRGGSSAPAPGSASP